MKKRYEVIEEQIERLKQKGLKFKDENKARKIILRENHFYITEGYEDVFIDLKESNKRFVVYEEDTYFEELYAIYKFDRDLKGLIFDYINMVENNVKSYVSYAFSDAYGNKDYIKRENFRPESRYDKEFEQLESQINSNLDRNFLNPKSDVKTYLDKNNFLPPWVLVKVFTFGNIVNFYFLMKIEEKQEVAQAFNISPYSLEDYLKMLNIVRNICAHGDILFNIRLNYRIKLRDCEYHKQLGIKKINSIYECGMNDLFAIMIILKKLLPIEEFDEMFIKIERLLSNLKKELDAWSYENLLKVMGFPQNYDLLNSIS